MTTLTVSSVGSNHYDGEPAPAEPAHYEKELLRLQKALGTEANPLQVRLEAQILRFRIKSAILYARETQEPRLPRLIFFRNRLGELIKAIPSKRTVELARRRLSAPQASRGHVHLNPGNTKLYRTVVEEKRKVSDEKGAPVTLAKLQQQFDAIFRGQGPDPDAGKKLHAILDKINHLPVDMEGVPSLYKQVKDFSDFVDRVTPHLKNLSFSN